MQTRNHRLTWYRWEWRDPYHAEYWTACTVSIYAPTYEQPHVSVLISIANGKGKVLMRCKSLAEAQGRIGIPEEGLDRLRMAETTAMRLLDSVHHDLRLVMGARDLAPGARVYRDDTGEVIGMSEEILRGSNG